MATDRYICGNGVGRLVMAISIGISRQRVNADYFTSLIVADSVHTPDETGICAP